jgi:hypothetical protein
LQAVIAGLVDLPVVVATVEQAVAAGAAVQAAATFQGVGHRAVQERWGLGAGAGVELVADSGDLRDRYAALRDAQA